MYNVHRKIFVGGLSWDTTHGKFTNTGMFICMKAENIRHSLDQTIAGLDYIKYYCSNSAILLTRRRFVIVVGRNKKCWKSVRPCTFKCATICGLCKHGNFGLFRLLTLLVLATHWVFWPPFLWLAIYVVLLPYVVAMYLSAQSIAVPT